MFVWFYVNISAVTITIVFVFVQSFANIFLFLAFK